MRKIIFLLFSVFSIQCINAQDVQSPEQFLGYKVGTKYTQHYKIVNYFKSVSSIKADMVKLEKYGETNEGRELLLTFISTPENLKNLEFIRLNNLRLTGKLKDNIQPKTQNVPAIVWLSYNVHGNEPSSSEAAMLTLFSLVDPSNHQTKEWLKNTVVVIDPCINPDGRDRYANWFNSVVGNAMNVDPFSREHSEPWPGGRSNHYNFDLNRDWAWQTQVESQQRMKKYNQWMPQIHVDFHEQGYNEPYYFAPAAEPLHEVITQWQRDFQVTIGKNHAKYFDQNGWLFFTKERFDLFYPSYGDTYPTYNGAIGMTYEQGGHSRGGLGVIKNDGDTLTLVDRVAHHYTTGLSTIEISAKNVENLLTEFKKFFDNNQASVGSDYKTYVLTSNDENKILAIKNLFDKNDIQYGIVNGKMKGYRYFTNKEEDVQLQKYQIAVSAYQPASSMAKVLLEPKNNLPDSNTYDITAWSIPYAYGVEAYALKEKKDINRFNVNSSPIQKIESNYGVLIPYTSLNSAKYLAYLLQNNVKVRLAYLPFTYAGKNFERGTLIVIKTSNSSSNWLKIVNEGATKFNIQPQEVSSGFMDKGADFGSPDIEMIKSKKIAMLTGEQVSSLNAGEVWHFFDQVLDYPISLLNANEISRISLKEYDVLIIPDGNYRALSDNNSNDKLKDFVRKGGKIVALDGAVYALAKAEWGLKIKEDKVEDKSEYALLKKYGNRERDGLVESIPGAIFKVEMDVTHPLAFGFVDNYYTLKQDGNLYEFIKEGWNVGVIKKENYVTGFSGYKVKNSLKDGLLFGVQPMGTGSVVYLADNPMFRSFWENGRFLFCNAVFLVQ